MENNPKPVWPEIENIGPDEWRAFQNETFGWRKGVRESPSMSGSLKSFGELAGSTFCCDAIWARTIDTKDGGTKTTIRSITRLPPTAKPSAE